MYTRKEECRSKELDVTNLYVQTSAVRPNKLSEMILWINISNFYS